MVTAAGDTFIRVGFLKARPSGWKHRACQRCGGPPAKCAINRWAPGEAEPRACYVCRDCLLEPERRALESGTFYRVLSEAV